MPESVLNRGLESLVCRLAPVWLPTGGERLALAEVLGGERVFAPHETLLQEHRPAEGLLLILEGFACRFRLLPDGRRQILGILLPGDLCELRLLLSGPLDHSVGALGAVRAALIPTASLAALAEQQPRLARALWWRATIEESMTREWLVNVGSRSAHARVAHLLCELYWRLEAAGLAHGGQCRLPLTQSDLGDAVALSAVHINRTLMAMRRASLARLHGGRLQILDRDALRVAAGFDPRYLQLAAESERWLPSEFGALPAQSSRMKADPLNA